MEIMCDIETMGTGHNGLVVSIGAVRFDWGTPPVMPSTMPPGYQVMDPSHFYVNILIASALESGLKVDGSTLRWWLYQSEEARKALFQPTPRPLSDALKSFTEWLNDGERFKDAEGGAGVWSHATFDFVKISDAYDAIGLPHPWHFRQARDIRTLNYLAYGPGRPPMTSKGANAHNALWDAYYQTLDVQQAVEVLAVRQGEIADLAALGTATRSWMMRTGKEDPLLTVNRQYGRMVDPVHAWADEVAIQSNGGH